MNKIKFKSKLITINGWTILHLPVEESAKLPSRGMTMVIGTINGVPFETVLEPDGRYMLDRSPSHWFRPSDALLNKADAKSGDEVEVSIETTKDWIDPEIPDDVKKALSSSEKAQALWHEITPIARWDWIRWIRAVKTEETRKKHLDVMLDKLNKGMRRPCCFNRSLCSEPHVSKNWKLLDPQS